MSGSIHLNTSDWYFIAICLEGFLYGIYTGLFSIYLQFQARKRSEDDSRRATIVFYSLCILYALSLVQVASDAIPVTTAISMNTATFNLSVVQSELFFASFIISNTLSGFCDFVSQAILIYRCWIVWNHNIRVVIVPSILAFTSLCVWMASNGKTVYDPLTGQFLTVIWGNTLVEIGLVLSLAVNAIVTGLIVLKIFKVYSEVSPAYDQHSGGSKLRALIFILIESGMALFSIQLAQVVTNNILTDNGLDAGLCIIGIHQMLNGIIPTIIQLRVSMGLSFYDQSSLVGVASDLHFRSNSDHSNSIRETENNDIDYQENKLGDDDNLRVGSNDVVHQGSGDDDIVVVQRSNDEPISDIIHDEHLSAHRYNDTV